jgi:hypothetical protein
MSALQFVRWRKSGMKSIICIRDNEQNGRLSVELQNVACMSGRRFTRSTNVSTGSSIEGRGMNHLQSFNEPAASRSVSFHKKETQAGGAAKSFGTGPSFGFTERDIVNYAPTTSGVYGIFNQAGYIFVGEAQDIEDSLLAHLRGESAESYWIRSQNPTGFAFEPCYGRTRALREIQLIAELNPICNQN